MALYLNIINKYIVKNLILATIVIIILIAGIDICVTFIVEQANVSKGQYTTLNAFQYALLVAPAHIAAGFPVLCLVGMVVGLSLLNHHNEIVIIRANGYSLLKICTIAVITAFFMSLIILGVNEWVAPVFKQNAEIKKAVAKSGGQALQSKHGFWLRSSGDFIHINKISYDGELSGITRYNIDDTGLKKISFAEKARYIQGEWHAYNVSKTILGEEVITSDKQVETIWHSFLKPEFLRVVSVKPEDLSLTGLYKYIKYRKKNGLYFEQYKLALWQKLLQPLTVMVMIFLAVPFVFAEVRSTAVSKRLILSILVGVSYFLLDKVFAAVVQFYDIPILFGAIGPALFFMILALWWLWRSNWQVN